MSEPETIRRERARLRALFRGRDLARPDRYAPARPAVRLEQTLIDATLADWPLAAPGSRILEIGCGQGAWLPRLARLSPQLLAGVDLVTERLHAARRREAGAMLAVACGSALPFADASFDLVVLATVTSGVREDAMRRALAAEVRRILRPGAKLLHHDLVRSDPRGAPWGAVTPADAAALFRMPIIRSKTLGLLPPLARALGPCAPWLGARLARWPLLRSHGLALLERRERDG